MLIPFSIPFAQPLVFRTATVNGGGGVTNHSFFSQALGAEYYNRRMFVCLSWEDGNARTVLSASINGVAAVIHANSGSALSGSAIMSALVPTGTTGTIFIGMSGGTDDIMLAVYAVYDLIYPTPTFAFADTGAPLTVNAVTPADGILLACTDFPSGSSGVFTGTTTNYEAENGSAALEVGFSIKLAASASHTVSYSTGTRSLCVVTWR